MIVWFVNRKFCNDALEKNKQLMSLNKTELGFKPDVALYISENLTPFNQRLAWQCRELKRARLIHSCWSSKGVVKIRRTMNERALSIDSEKDLTVLYPDFVFKGRDGSKWKRLDVFVICFLFLFLFIMLNYFELMSLLRFIMSVLSGLLCKPISQLVYKVNWLSCFCMEFLMWMCLFCWGHWFKMI